MKKCVAVVSACFLVTSTMAINIPQDTIGFSGKPFDNYSASNNSGRIARDTSGSYSLRKGYRYNSFQVNIGVTPLQITDTRIRARFPYYRLGQSHSYDDMMHLSGMNSAPSLNLTFEGGKTTGGFRGLNLHANFPSLDLHNYSCRDLGLDYVIGTNIILNNRLTLRPAVMIGVDFFSVDFSNTIDNAYDVTAFDTSFPHVYRTSGKYANTYYNKTVYVSFRETNLTAKFRLELNYNISPRVAFQISGGYCYSLSDYQYIGLSGARLHSYTINATPGLVVQSDTPVDKIASCNGLFFNIGLSFRYKGPDHLFVKRYPAPLRDN